MKKVFLICIMLFFTAFPIVVSATDGTTSDTSDYFDTKVLPSLISGGTGLGGSLTFFLVLFRKVKKGADDATDTAQKGINTASEKLTTGLTKLEEFEAKVEDKLKKVQEIEGSVDKKIAEFTGSMEKKIALVQEQNQTMFSKVGEMTADVKKTAVDQANTLQILKLGLCNNAELMKNGYAKQIAAIGSEVNEIKERTEAAVQQG